VRFDDLVRHDGNASLFRAIEMSVLSTSVNEPFHLHVEGLRGTGKTTIMRAVRGVLPKILRIKGCPYNCLPHEPHCPEHRDLPPELIRELGCEFVPMPFLEISHSAKIGTVVGSIDLKKVMDENRPEAALLPGTLPKANRGIVFVDEINRLAEMAPELADVLLSAMGTKPGRIQIEETGLDSVQLPVSLSVWAASNPDEDPGPLEEIRRQLADRFDASIEMSRPKSVTQVLSILHKHAKAAPAAVLGGFLSLVTQAQSRQVHASDEITETIARLYLDFGLESLRSIESLLHASRLQARLLGHNEVLFEDVADVAALVLRHRVDSHDLQKILSHLRGLSRQPAVAGAGQYLAETAASTAEPAHSAEAKSAGSADTQTAPLDMLSRFAARLKNALSASDAPKTDDSAKNVVNSAGTPTSEGGYQIADPMGSKLSAPTARAVSIANLPETEVVTTMEELPGAHDSQLG
jgi:magnesium chelatase subunit I